MKSVLNTVATPAVTAPVATPVAPATQPQVRFTNEALIGSGYQNDGSPFINIGFDREMSFDVLADALKAGKRISLQPVKAINARTPARKYVLVLRAPQA